MADCDTSAHAALVATWRYCSGCERMDVRGMQRTYSEPPKKVAIRRYRVGCGLTTPRFSEATSLCASSPTETDPSLLKEWSRSYCYSGSIIYRYRWLVVLMQCSQHINRCPANVLEFSGFWWGGGEEVAI